MKIKRVLRLVMVLPLVLAELTTGALASERVNARAAVMIDASTGQVLYEQNANQKLPVASISKLLTWRRLPAIRPILLSVFRRDNPVPFGSC